MSEREIELRLKELAFQELQLEDAQKERLLREKQMHLEHERFLKEVELKHAALNSSSASSSQFDVVRNIRLVPPFAEKNVEKYFLHFERVATVSKWPTHAWTLLLQSVLVGRAQEAYSALSIEDSKDYVKVKDAILRTYELVPEAYRQRFRSLSKLDEQTYVDFAKEKETSFNSWCKSQKAETKEDLKQLVLLEEFKNCLPKAVCIYLNEQKVTTLDKAAVLADEFELTHKVNFDSEQGEQKGRALFNRSRFPKPLPTVSTVSTRKLATASTPVEKVCFYCKNSGHFIADCPVLSKKQESCKPVALIKSAKNYSTQNMDQPVQKCELAGSSSFLMDGFVSLGHSTTKKPIKIWRDTGAFQSLILHYFLQFTDQSALGSNALVQGFGGGYLSLPMHNLKLETGLVSGEVAVALCSSIPIEGVSLILGNDLAGGRVLAAPEVVPFPLVSKSPDELEKQYPETFPVCVATRAMLKKKKQIQEADSDIALFDTFLAKGDMLGFGKVFPSCDELKCEQGKDVTLSPLFDEVVSEDEVTTVSGCYFLNNGVLMRKWTSPKMSCYDDWSSVFQVVVPSVYRHDVLQLAHDHCLAGHMGIKKTLDRVLRHFF